MFTVPDILLFLFIIRVTDIECYLFYILFRNVELSFLHIVSLTSQCTDTAFLQRCLYLYWRTNKKHHTR